MATYSFYYSVSQKGKIYATGTLDYGQYAYDDRYEYVITKISVTNKDITAAHSFKYVIRIAGVSYASGTFSNVGPGVTESDTLSISQIVERGHSSNTGLRVTGSVSDVSDTAVYTTIDTTIPAKKSYTVTYNANGGSGAPSSQTKWYNENLSLSSTQPTRSGYSFYGWNTSSTANAGQYLPGQSYTKNEALSLYAVWGAVITYKPNGGTGSAVTQTKIRGSAVTIKATNTFTRTNYVFKSWNTKADGTGTTYNAGASYTSESTLTLYAMWYPPHTITYNANGGSGAPSSQLKVHNQTQTLSSTTPTRSGYSFDGWNTKADGTGTNYSKGQSYTTNASLTLYAKWLKEPAVPTISSMSVVRVDENGNADDEGTYGKVTVEWSVDTTSDVIDDNTGTVSGRYASSTDEQASMLTWTGTYQNATGGTAVAMFPASIDEQCAVVIIITDKKQSVLRTDILTRARFTMDFLKGGEAIGIGSAAPSNGLLVAWDVSVAGTFDASNGIVQNGSEATINFHSTNRNQPWVHLYENSSDNYGDAVVIGDGGMTIIGAGESADELHTALLEAGKNNGTEEMYISSDSVVYIVPNCQTIGNRTQYAFRSNQLIAPGTIDTQSDLINRDGSLPSEDQYTTDATTGSHPSAFRLIDMDGELIGYIRGVRRTNGTIGLQLFAWNEKTDGTTTYNHFDVNVAMDGTATYAMSNPEAFRNALGASSGVFPVSVGGTGINSNPSMLTNLASTTAANVFAASPRPGVTGTLPRSHGGTGMTARTTGTVTRNSLSTAGTLNAYSNGVVCTVSGRSLQLKAALDSGSSVALATLPTGYRPPTDVYSPVYASVQSRNCMGFVRIESNGTIYFTNVSGASWATSHNIAFTVTWAL